MNANFFLALAFQSRNGTHFSHLPAVAKEMVMMGPTRIFRSLRMSHCLQANSAFCPSICFFKLLRSVPGKKLSKNTVLNEASFFLALPILWSGCPNARAISIAAALQSLLSNWVWLERVTLPAET